MDQPSPVPGRGLGRPMVLTGGGLRSFCGELMVSLSRGDRWRRALRRHNWVTRITFREMLGGRTGFGWEIRNIATAPFPLVPLMGPGVGWPPASASSSRSGADPGGGVWRSTPIRLIVTNWVSSAFPQRAGLKRCSAHRSCLWVTSPASDVGHSFAWQVVRVTVVFRRRELMNVN